MIATGSQLDFKTETQRNLARHGSSFCNHLGDLLHRNPKPKPLQIEIQLPTTKDSKIFTFISTKASFSGTLNPNGEADPGSVPGKRGAGVLHVE